MIDFYSNRYNDMFTTLNRRTFSDIFPTVDSFLKEYKTISIPQVLDETTVATIYWLLISKYANSSIMSSDENRFTYDLFSIVYAQGPVWAKKVDLQQKLSKLTDEEIRAGSFARYNHAYNPSTEPTTEELDEINEQNTTKYTKDKVTAYSNLNALLVNDVTGPFLQKFRKLFYKGIVLGDTLWYYTPKDNN